MSKYLHLLSSNYLKNIVKIKNKKYVKKNKILYISGNEISVQTSTEKIWNQKCKKLIKKVFLN